MQSKTLILSLLQVTKHLFFIILWQKYDLKKLKKFAHKMASSEKMQKMQIQLSCIHMTIYFQTLCLIAWVLSK